MSNNQVGMVYQQIIADVVESSRVDFEEGGVDDNVLEELRLVSPPLPSCDDLLSLYIPISVYFHVTSVPYAWLDQILSRHRRQHDFQYARRGRCGDDKVVMAAACACWPPPVGTAISIFAGGRPGVFGLYMALGILLCPASPLPAAARSRVNLLGGSHLKLLSLYPHDTA